jgi:hypothetical protein
MAANNTVAIAEAFLHSKKAIAMCFCTLRHQRKKDVMEFNFGDSGKTAYFAVQIENEGKKGPWGPLVSAIIP